MNQENNKNDRVKNGGSKLTTNKEVFHKWIKKEDTGPLVIEVGVTYGCNQDCVHCSFQQFKKYDHYDFIHRESFLDFLDDFKEMGGIEVYFAGNGEPLLHPNICEFFEYGNKIGLDMSMSTNGVPLTQEMAERILPNAKWINISISGGNVKTYSKIHKCPDSEFYEVIENIKSGFVLSFLCEKLS